jgi:tetratricopeptide (TPR) repeat protein
MPDSGSIVLSRADQLNIIGHRCFISSNMEGARLHFLAALSIEPEHVEALQNLGAVLRVLQHFDAAASVARRSVALKPDNTFAASNLGISLLTLKQWDEALTILERVVQQLPEQSMAWHNYGLGLYMSNQREKALPMFDKSLALAPDNPQVQSDRALTLLSLGKLGEGLEAYESRWQLLAKNRIWGYGIPEWQGENLNGSHILVHHEQGFGDSLMLVRFVRLLAVERCILTLAVPAELVRLFTRSFPWVNVVDTETLTPEDAVKFNYHSPLLSLMRWVGITHPAQIDAKPYLRADADFNLRLPKAQMKIGLCWASGDRGPILAERRRVVPLTKFLPLTEIPGAAVVSLQKGPDAAAIVNNGLEGIVFDLSYRLEDFAATADVIQQLDLVVSVDSAVAHLAGALGKPCLMLSPYTRCWRWWMPHDGEPWYADMGIYDQGADGSWNNAVAEVVDDVKMLMGR